MPPFMKLQEISLMKRLRVVKECSLRESYTEQSEIVPKDISKELVSAAMIHDPKFLF